MTATYPTVQGLTAMTENVAHKLIVENIFLSPELFDDFHIKTINCSTVTPNKREIPGNFGKTLKFKCGDKDPSQG